MLSFFAARHLVLIASISDPSVPALEGIIARHGLTRAEATLACELAAGRSLTDAAERLARSRSTVRNQLQSIFAKTATHRQAELVAKILRGPA